MSMATAPESALDDVGTGEPALLCLPGWCGDLLDWMVLGPPPGFLDALAGLPDPAAGAQVRAVLFDSWTSGVEVPALDAYVGRLS
jgi:hypothetical protein